MPSTPGLTPSADRTNGPASAGTTSAPNDATAVPDERRARKRPQAVALAADDSDAAFVVLQADVRRMAHEQQRHPEVRDGPGGVRRERHDEPAHSKATIAGTPTGVSATSGVGRTTMNRFRENSWSVVAWAYGWTKRASPAPGLPAAVADGERPRQSGVGEDGGGGVDGVGRVQGDLSTG